MRPGRPAGRPRRGAAGSTADLDAVRGRARSAAGSPDRPTTDRATPRSGPSPRSPASTTACLAKPACSTARPIRTRRSPASPPSGTRRPAVPGRGQHERVRHPVVACENSALAAGRRLEQVGIDATRLERAARAGGKPGDADCAPQRPPEAAAPGRAHIARHPHLLPCAEAKIEGCNFERAHCWYR